MDQKEVDSCADDDKEVCKKEDFMLRQPQIYQDNDDLKYAS